MLSLTSHCIFSFDLIPCYTGGQLVQHMLINISLQCWLLGLITLDSSVVNCLFSLYIVTQQMYCHPSDALHYLICQICTTVHNYHQLLSNWRQLIQGISSSMFAPTILTSSIINNTNNTNTSLDSLLLNVFTLSWPSGWNPLLNVVSYRSHWMLWVQLAWEGGVTKEYAAHSRSFRCI